MALATQRRVITRANLAVRTLMNEVLAEYTEMPGLSLTLPQATRLWAVDRVTCREALRRLVALRVLRLTPEGRFVQAWR